MPRLSLLSVLAEKFLGGFPVGIMGLLLRFVRAKIDVFPILLNLGNPAPPMDGRALQPVPSGSDVHLILGVSDVPQVDEPVISSHAVDVVDLTGNDPVSYVPRKAMKQDGASCPVLLRSDNGQVSTRGKEPDLPPEDSAPAGNLPKEAACIGVVINVICYLIHIDSIQRV